MLIHWEEKSARWFEQASEYTRYHEQLAALLLPYIKDTKTLCDLGCGIGLIDMALGMKVAQITGVDANAYALSYMEKLIHGRNIKNITMVNEDARQLKGLWDTVLMVFFGNLDQDLEHYLNLADKQLIAIVHGNPEPGKKETAKCNTVDYTQKLLAQKGIEYELLQSELEYGQPFVDIEQGIDYIRAYRKYVPQGEEENYFKEKTILTGREDFPYYMPHTKKFGIFVIRRNNHENI